MQHSKKIVQAAKMKRELLTKLLEIIMTYSRVTIKNDTEVGFRNKIKSCFFDNGDIYHTFILSKIYRLEICNEYVFLWQDAKGQISYSFCLRDKEEFTTTALKLGNALSGHFVGSKIEVVNNENEWLKKQSIVITGLNKSMIDSQRYDDYSVYSQHNHQPYDTNTIQTDYDPVKQIFQPMTSPVVYNQAIQPYQQPIETQKLFYDEAIKLHSQQLRNNYETLFIYINKLPIVHKNLFSPFERASFYINDRGLRCKNSYRPSKYMIDILSSYVEQDSFILSYIFFMAKKNIENAMNIFVWLVGSFSLMGKTGDILVLRSEENLFMKLFYEEIIMPLFNADHCEQVDNESLDKKSLSVKLDQKVIYNFHNITTPSILGESAKEFTRKLMYKDDLKINNKTVTTQANILITSTTSYIPLIAQDVQSVFVDVESNLDDFCKEKNIKRDPYVVTERIKSDLYYFAAILRRINLDTIKNFHSWKYYSGRKDIIDGDASLLEIFYSAIKNKDIVIFIILKTKAPKLYQILVEDFKHNRVNRKNLIEYFIALFGEEIYTRKNYRTFIMDLRNLSSTKEPFENERTFQIHDQVYYTL